MLQKALFVSYSTPNYEKLTNVYLESLKNIGVTKIEHKIDQDIDYQTNCDLGFRSEFWYKSVKNKIRNLINVLKNKKSDKSIEYFIQSDCDIQYFSKNVHEWENLEYFIKNNEKQIFFMRERRIHNKINSGFFIIKNNEHINAIIGFFESVILNLDTRKIKDLALGDQTVINIFLKRQLIKYDFIPTCYVIWGERIYDINKALFHHAVCASNIETKLNQIKEIKKKLKKI